MFAFLAVLDGKQLADIGEYGVPILWVVNSLVLVIIGIFTLRRAE